MCFLTVSSRPCLETSPHGILQTPFAGHCLGDLWGGKPCPAELSEGVNRVFRTLSGDNPLPILQTPSAGHCLDTWFRSFRKFQAQKSEVSKRGWRTEKVGARRSFLCDRFRPLFCTPFPIPPHEKGDKILGTFFGCLLGPTPSRQPLFSRKEKAHKHKQIFRWLPGRGGGEVSRPGGQGSNVYVLCAEPKEHKHFRPGARLGGSVTGVTEKLFMC